MFDFKSIPKDLKNFLINSLTLPLWYISIFYYFPSVYAQDDILLIACVCISLSIFSYMLFSMLIMETNISKPEETPFDFGVVLPAILLQLFWLSILIFFGYLTSFFWDVKFEYYGFLLVYFGVPFIIFIASNVLREKNK